MSQRQTKSPWYVYGDVDFPLDRVAAQTPRAVHTASRREEGRDRRTQEPGRKPKVPKKSTALVPTAPAAVKQAEFDFVKDVKGREWDYCVLVTNDEKMDAWALSQLYRDRGDCENNFDEFKNQWGWSGFTTHAESELIQRAFGTVAAFFRWLKSTAEHLDEKTRWYVVLRCAFRKLLMPEQPLGAVIPIQ